MILDETRERFLMAIAKQVDPARIAEVHFFAPIRQGGVESGVAVIAAARTVEAAPEPIDSSTAEGSDPSKSSRTQDDDSSSLTPDAIATSPAQDDTMASAGTAPAVAESTVAALEGVDSAIAAGENSSEASPPREDDVHSPSPSDDSGSSSPSDDSTSSSQNHDSASSVRNDDSASSPQTDDSTSSFVQNDDSASPTPNDDSAAADTPALADASAPAPAPIERHVIYTARYRLTLKGPDRGKWETHVTAEADAPIITVDAVVRGVQRRAGDVDDPTRMTGDEVRASLPTH